MDETTIPKKSWSLDDLDDQESPADFIIGHLSKRWEADETSLEEATLGLLAASYAQFLGMTPDEAVDLAMKHCEAGVTLKWDGGSELSVALKEDA